MFKSDRQRRAAFAHMNKFASKPIDYGLMKSLNDIQDANPKVSGENTHYVVGFTGSEIEANVCPTDPDNSMISLDVIDNSDRAYADRYSPYEEGETIILAGDDFKRYRDPGSMNKAFKIVDVLGDENHKKELIRGLAELERKEGRPVFSSSKELDNCSDSKSDHFAESPRSVYSNPHDALTNDEKKAYIDKVVMEGSLTPGQNEALLNMRNRLSKRPQAIGSKWKGENYEHGPRIRQPKDFIFMKTVDYDEKYRKFEDGYRLPKDMSKGSKVVIGKLKDGGDWAVQSTLRPI